MKRIFSALFSAAFFIFHVNSTAQSAPEVIASGGDLNVLYRNEATGQVFAHSRGFGANYRRIKHVTGSRKRIIEAELLSMRHPKETRLKRDQGKSFFYGKLNSLMMLRGGFGYQNTLYKRAERKSVEIRVNYTVGPTLCLAKPVFLEIEYPDPFNIYGTITKTEKYDPARHDENNILGRAPYIYGFDQLKVYPGAHAKLGFSFEYGELRTAVKAIETGVMVDAFPNPVRTMAKNPAESVFVTLYVGINFGKRWF